ncbi:histidine phosphatase family protein [Clostridium sp. C2-6-12]|uniref:histidine phosphatase family protein n=1 Tax=Clostridium sp. C2-6-12 TaxID=2698832 RepID=UPI001371FFF5|nr:histidine phosphatase family protein [Clostridium sp. C2-6-12]
MKRYIYLLRHGETEYGREKRYLGHTDCKLSETGKEQAKRLAGIFTRDKIIIDNIFSSDLSRCKDTINIVFPNQKVTFLVSLREINMGDWDGLTFDEVKSKYAEDYVKRGENIGGFIPQNGESFNQCQNRAVDVFRHIVNSAEGNIVICSHAGFIRTLLCNILNKDLAEMFNIKQDYGCINIITVDENNIFVEGINLNAINKD